MKYHPRLRRSAQQRRGQRGQTLIIMAFLSTFLIVLLGLVVDSVRLYVLSAQAERTAEASALAGALYMPDYYNTPAPAPDNQDAISRVCDVARQNGITNCPAAPGTVGATPSVVAGNSYELQVTVTLQADVFFLNFVSPNLSTSTIARSATAQFLPPIALGSRAAAFGDGPDADNVQAFYARLNGPSSLQSNGDAFTPVLQEGPTDPINYPDGGSYRFSRWGGTVCCTNHQQYGQCSGCPAGPIANPDQHPAGFTGSDGGSGYNYEILVPPGAGDVQVQIFNPAFDPDNQQGVNSNGHDDMGSACSDPLFNTGGCKTDQQNEYLQMSYSLYSAPVFFERDTDSPLITWSPASFDNIGSDNTAHGCTGVSQPMAGSPTVWDPQQQTCVSAPTYYENWYTLYTITQPGTYRLVVEPEASNTAAPSTAGYGEHEYGLKLTDSASTTNCMLGATSITTTCPTTDGPRIWAWNDMCVYFIVNGTTTFDLGEIPAAYAGKTLNFSLYDPGDGNDVNMAILDPTGTAVALPNWVRTAGGSGGTIINASQSGDAIYNGLWLHLPITIPAAYNPAPGSDWWQVQYTGSAVNDTITISISLSGSPIHLVSEVF